MTSAASAGSIVGPRSGLPLTFHSSQVPGQELGHGEGAGARVDGAVVEVALDLEHGGQQRGGQVAVGAGGPLDDREELGRDPGAGAQPRHPAGVAHRRDRPTQQQDAGYTEGGDHQSELAHRILPAGVPAGTVPRATYRPAHSTLRRQSATAASGWLGARR
jgi:hypothetical protein